MENEIILPSFLKPYKCKDIIRLGKDFDGGYLVSKNAVENSQKLISIGISYDWSFEKDFHKLNKCRISTFDGSVGRNFFTAKIKHRIRNVFKQFSLNYFKKTLWWILLPIRFFSFFNSFSKIHNERFIYTNQSDLEIDNFVLKHGYRPSFINLEDLFENIDNNNIFMKIDIEGGEYSILDVILKYQDKLVSLAIEFHDLNKSQYQILNKFTSHISLSLIHTHINTSGPINDEGLPTVLELTFSRIQTYDGKVSTLPHILDMPTSKDDVIYEVKFSESKNA